MVASMIAQDQGPLDIERKVWSVDQRERLNEEQQG